MNLDRRPFTRWMRIFILTATVWGPTRAVSVHAADPTSTQIAATGACGTYSFRGLNQCDGRHCHLIIRKGTSAELSLQYEAPSPWYPQVSGQWVTGNLDMISRKQRLIRPRVGKPLWIRALPPLPPDETANDLILLRAAKCADE